MRFCGNCGASVDPSVRVTGVCAACGTHIAPSGDVLDAHSTPATVPAVPGPGGAAPPYGSSRPLPSIASAPTPRWPVPGFQSPRRRRLGAAFVALLVVAGLLATLMVVLANRPRHGLASAQATPTATTSPTQTPVPATPTATATDTPTPAAAPVLAVSPTNMSAGLCTVLTSRSFTVSNTGGGSLKWTATASDPAYQIDPASGTLVGGDPPQTVTVNQISGPGTVTITADGADGSPQVVKFSCI